MSEFTVEKLREVFTDISNDKYTIPEFIHSLSGKELKQSLKDSELLEDVNNRIKYIWKEVFNR